MAVMYLCLPRSPVVCKRLEESGLIFPLWIDRSVRAADKAEYDCTKKNEQINTHTHTQRATVLVMKAAGSGHAFCLRM